MKKSELLIRLTSSLQSNLQLLEDKPEETVETTLKALWLAASGNPVSAERALGMQVPDLSTDQENLLIRMVDQRLNNIPLAHITGRQNFLGIELLCDKRALIPRKETEILGKNALELSKSITAVKGHATIIDACCGSGNLGIAIAWHNSGCMVYSSDISHEAVELTRDNIRMSGLGDRVSVEQGDLLGAYETERFFGKVDLIVCNPPYILSSKVTKMHTEIASNEPVLAFDGGMLGIRIIQRLIAEAPRLLADDGWLIFEIGLGQGEFIAQLCDRSKMYDSVETIADNAGNVRVIKARKLLPLKS